MVLMGFFELTITAFGNGFEGLMRACIGFLLYFCSETIVITTQFAKIRMVQKIRKASLTIIVENILWTNRSWAQVHLVVGEIVDVCMKVLLRFLRVEQCWIAIELGPIVIHFNLVERLVFILLYRRKHLVSSFDPILEIFLISLTH